MLVQVKSEMPEEDLSVADDTEEVSASRSIVEGPLPFLVWFVASVAVLFQYASSGELSIPVLFFTCFCVGVLLAWMVTGARGFELGVGIKVFTLAYSINVLLMIALAAYYQSEYGRAFLWNPYAMGDDVKALAQYASGIIRNSSTGLNDDLKFHIVGTAIARDWIKGTHDSLQLLKHFNYIGYPWLVGAILYFSQLFGDMSPLAPRVVNCMFGGLLVVSIYALASSLYGFTVGKRSAVIAAIFPAISFYAANTFRDILIAFFIVVSTLAVFRLKQAGSVYAKTQDVLVFLVSGVALLVLRSPALYTILAAYALYFSLYSGGLLIKRILLGLLLSGLLAVATINVSSFSNQTIDYLARQGESWDEARLAGSAKGSLAIQYIFDAPVYISLPLRTVYTVFSPIPPFISASFPHLVEGTGALIWYFFVPFWLVGLWKSLRDRERALVAITSVVVFLSVVYVGGALRHKALFMALGFVHVSYAAEVLWGRKMTIILATALGLSILAGLYGVLKFY